ncbi:MAG: DNA recombination protein RmuC [Christensenellales bacterium]|jgi:DNA recombination protein RmuC
MDVVSIGIGVLNLIILAILLIRIKSISDQNVYAKNNAELLVKLSEFKGEIVEKVNEKNISLSKDVTAQIEGLKTGNRDSLDKINDTLNNKIGGFQNDVFEKFDSITTSVRRSLSDNRNESNNDIEKFKKDITDCLDSINKTLEAKITALQTSNEAKLEQMRGVVEEKLEKTLNDRLKLSFETVSKNLESVQKGLGEMQSLATDVGGLKKAINNVKTRGVFGEVQLERILEQMLTAAQYEKNAQVKSRSQERIEFAIKLPGKNDESFVFLPIDSKFPSENYDALLAAYDSGEKNDIAMAKTVFANKIKTFAKEISGKYINPPTTTDFAILFLPFESLYAEVVQTPGLFEELQSKYKITVTGPTTLSAFLNALQMGFKTLTIEKHSSEVWNILGAVKTEFKTFEGVLNSVQKKLRGADDELSKLVGTRTNVINRKLRTVNELPESDARVLLPVSSGD